MRSDAPSGSPKQYTDPKTIDSLLKSSDPEAVAESGRSYQKFAAAYEKIAGELLTMRSDLHDAWGGQDAAAAQSQLREVWSAATTVQKTASTFGIAVERHGSESLAWYKYNKPPSKNLADAQSWMTGANERVSQSWGSLPPDLSTTLPPAQRVDEHGPASGRLPSSGTGASGSSSAGSSTAGSGGRMPGSSGRLPGGGHTTSPGGTGSHLAGLPTSGGVGSVPGGGLGLPPGAGGGFSPGSTPLSPGGGSMPGSGIPGLIGPMGGRGGVGVGRGGTGSAELKGASPDGRAISSPGSATAEEAQAAEAGAAARAGIAGPMIGGGADRQERERVRETWLAEDEDVWTGDVESTLQLIGADAGAPKAPEPPETPVEIDLSGDDDIITGLLEELGGAEVKDTAAEIADLRAKLERLERQAEVERGISAGSDNDAKDMDWLDGEGV